MMYVRTAAAAADSSSFFVFRFLCFCFHVFRQFLRALSSVNAVTTTLCVVVDNDAQLEYVRYATTSNGGNALSL